MRYTITLLTLLFASSCLQAMIEIKQSHAQSMSLGALPADAADFKRSLAAQQEQEVRKEVKQVAGRRKTKVQDDAAFDATGLPAEVQTLIKEYTLSPMRYFQAVHKKHFIPIQPSDMLLVLSNELCATIPHASIERHNVHIWDIATGACKHTLAHNAPVSQLIKTPAGLLISASRDAGTIRIWNPKTGQEVITIQTPVHALAVITDNLLAIGHDQTLTIWDINQNRAIASHELASSFIAPAITGCMALPNQNLLIKDFFAFNHRLQIWSPEAGLRMLKLPLPGLFHVNRELYLLPNGHITIFDHHGSDVFHTRSTSIFLYDPLQEKVIYQTQHKGFIDMHHFATNATHVASVTENNIITVKSRTAHEGLQISLETLDPSISRCKIQFSNDLLIIGTSHCTYTYDYHNILLRKIYTNKNQTFHTRVEHTPDAKAIVHYSDFINYGTLSCDCSVYVYDASAYADLCTLSAEQLIMLEKLMQQFLSTYGLHNAPYEKSHVLAGEMLKNFKNLPKSIQNCLASQYNITVEDDLKDSGMQMACAIL